MTNAADINQRVAGQAALARTQEAQAAQRTLAQLAAQARDQDRQREQLQLEGRLRLGDQGLQAIGDEASRAFTFSDIAQGFAAQDEARKQREEDRIFRTAGLGFGFLGSAMGGR